MFYKQEYSILFFIKGYNLKKRIKNVFKCVKKMRLECKPLLNPLLIISREDKKIYYLEAEDYIDFINKDEFSVLDHKVFSLDFLVLLKEILLN